MKTVKIAVCGSGFRYSERIDLFKQLEATVSGASSYVEDFVQAAIRHMLVDISDVRVDIVTFQGSVMGMRQFYPKLLEGADIIVYVISGMIPRYEGKEFLRSADIDQQVTDFERYTTYGSELDVLWNKVPWIWVLTEDAIGAYVTKGIDLILENPLLDTPMTGIELPVALPSTFQQDIIKCHVHLGRGVDVLWDLILVKLATK